MSILRAMKAAELGASISNKFAARGWLRRLAASPLHFHLDDDLEGIFGSRSAEKYLSKKRDEVFAMLGEKDAWRTYWAALVKADKVPKGPVQRNPAEKLFVRLGRERVEREQADALRDALFKARGGLSRVREDSGVSFESVSDFYAFFLRHRGASDPDTRAIYKRLSWVPLKGSESLLAAENEKTTTAAKSTRKRMSRATSAMHKKVDFLYENLRDERTGKRLYPRAMVAGFVANLNIPGHTTGMPMPPAQHRGFLAGLTRMANKWAKRRTRKNPAGQKLSASEERYLLALRSWATGKRLHMPAKPPNMTWEKAQRFVDLAETMRGYRSNPRGMDPALKAALADVARLRRR